MLKRSPLISSCTIGLINKARQDLGSMRIEHQVVSTDGIKILHIITFFIEHYILTSNLWSNNQRTSPYSVPNLNGVIFKNQTSYFWGQYYSVEIAGFFCHLHILREINFGECRSSKNAIFAILRARSFVNLVNFTVHKVQKFIKFKIQRLSIG